MYMLRFGCRNSLPAGVTGSSSTSPALGDSVVNFCFVLIFGSPKSGIANLSDPILTTKEENFFRLTRRILLDYCRNANLSPT